MSTKTQYLDRLRSQSSYSELRGFAKISELSGRITGAIIVVFGLLSFVDGVGELLKGRFYIPQIWVGISTMLVGFILLLLGLVLKNVLIALADIADSITDLNCRYEAPDQ